MMRQPASENSFTVACPMPREAPVNTMVFCSTAGRSSCGDTPGKGQSTVFSSGNPARIAVKVGIARIIALSTIGTAARSFAKRGSSIFRHGRICTIRANPHEADFRGLRCRIAVAAKPI
jgi:hypothetical protein